MDKPVIKIYTDGACSPNPGIGGWAAIIVYDDREVEISGKEENTTNNRMELQAAVEALKVISEPSRITIITDSAYVSNAFNQKWLEAWVARGWTSSTGKAIKNIEIWQELVVLMQKHEVQWTWIKGHNEHVHNERCDKLAVAARLT